MLLLQAKRTYVPSKLLIILTNILKIILQKWLAYVRFVGRRRFVLLLLPLVLLLLLLWPTLWWFAVRSSWALLPSPEQFPQYKMNRSLHHYLQHIQILIEPTVPPCDNANQAPVIIMVASTSPRAGQRAAVRDTWGVFQPTFFAMGLYEDKDRQLADNHKEADLFNDIIVFDFRDQHQNQSLKTALMMKWTLVKCPQAHFLFKTQDDVMVNPWMLNKVLWHNINAPIVGYSLNNSSKSLLRNEYRKVYNPRAQRDDEVLTYLSGTGYLIRGDYIAMILNKALHVPIINLEDVYFTYLVAHKQLGLTLAHDRRLSPYKPWLKTGCVYWNLASIHSLTPTEMREAWSSVESLVLSYATVAGVCKNFNFYFNWFRDLVLY